MTKQSIRPAFFHSSPPNQHINQAVQYVNCAAVKNNPYFWISLHVLPKTVDLSSQVLQPVAYTKNENHSLMLGKTNLP